MDINFQVIEKVKEEYSELKYRYDKLALSNLTSFTVLIMSRILRTARAMALCICKTSIKAPNCIKLPNV